MTIKAKMENTCRLKSYNKHLMAEENIPKYVLFANEKLK